MSNHTVSDLKLGDIERVIQTNISKKGTEAQRPTGSMTHTMFAKAQGDIITIYEDGAERRYTRHKLRKVPNN